MHIEAFIEEQPTINEHFIKNVSKESNSYVTCFNKYELYARKFIMEHPISKYIPRDFYDEKNFSLKENKKINVVFLGFGKVSLSLDLIASDKSALSQLSNQSRSLLVTVKTYTLLNFGDSIGLTLIHKIKDFGLDNAVLVKTFDIIICVLFWASAVLCTVSGLIYLDGSKQYINSSK